MFLMENVRSRLETGSYTFAVHEISLSRIHPLPNHFVAAPIPNVCLQPNPRSLRILAQRFKVLFAVNTRVEMKMIKLYEKEKK